MKDFKNLKVWQKAHKTTLAIYESTISFPQQETYGLTSQLRRSASSVPANIAEGCVCAGSREFSRFLSIALRSASETESHLLLARDLKYLDVKVYEQLDDQVTEVKRMLTGLMQKLNADS